MCALSLAHSLAVLSLSRSLARTLSLSLYCAVCCDRLRSLCARSRLPACVCVSVFVCDCSNRRLAPIPTPSAPSSRVGLSLPYPHSLSSHPGPISFKYVRNALTACDVKRPRENCRFQERSVRCEASLCCSCLYLLACRTFLYIEYSLYIPYIPCSHSA